MHTPSPTTPIFFLIHFHNAPPLISFFPLPLCSYVQTFPCFPFFQLSICPGLTGLLVPTQISRYSFQSFYFSQQPLLLLCPFFGFSFSLLMVFLGSTPFGYGFLSGKDFSITPERPAFSRTWALFYGSFHSVWPWPSSNTIPAFTFAFSTSFLGLFAIFSLFYLCFLFLRGRGVLMVTFPPVFL